MNPIWKEGPKQNGPLVHTVCILLAFNANTDLTCSQNWDGQSEQIQTDSDHLGQRQTNLGCCAQ